MSYTYPVIPIGREETDRRLENVVNHIKRHCRIGKISPKPVRRVPDSFDLLKITQGLPVPKDWIFGTTYMAGCGCKVGTACNSVSCPHGPVLTC